MRKKQNKSLNRRRFLKVAAGSGAAFAAGNQVAGAQQVRPVENTGTGEGEASGARRPGSDFMVDVFKPLGFEYVSINPHSSSRGTPNFVRQPMRSMPRYATEAQLPEVALTDIYAFLKSIPAPPDSKSIPLLQNN
jgi:hypothetical protein